MNHLNKKIDDSFFITVASLVATVFTFAIMAGASNMITTIPEAATTTTTTASGIELSAEPVYQEEQISVSETPINETHIQSIVSGNGTINLPNSTETINNINNGSYIISTRDGSVLGKEVWSTEDETENVTTTFYSIVRFGMQQQETNKGIIIAVVHTNSTGKLASLDGMILAGQVEFRPDESRLVTLWEWESEIPLPTSNTTITEEPLQMNTTTNATTADEINATAAPLSPPPEEEVIVEEQQQQQATPTAPAPALEY